MGWITSGGCARNYWITLNLSRVIRSFLAQPLDMIGSIRSSYSSNNVYVCNNFSSKTLALEKPVETAMLTSLTGVKCIIGNQWYCTLAENASKLNTSMKGRLTSLTGVKCIIGNQWYCTLAENASKLNTSMKGRLTSLTGVKCIISNQWYCTLAENASKLNTSMKGR